MPTRRTVRALRVPLLELATAGGTALLVWIGGSGVLNHWWSVGQLVVAVSYLNSMVSPIKSLSRLSVIFAQGQASGERILGILDEPRSPAGSEAGLPVRAAGRIDFRCVSMAYGSRPALGGLDLTVLPDERVALTGPNGVGKSTSLALIAGLYPPTLGSVAIDGRAATELPEPWLHRQVSVVLHDTYLFPGTLAENIRYARPDADDADVAVAPGPRSSPTSRSTFRTVSPPGSVTAGPACRAASASAWASPVRCSPTRPSSCWTNRRPAWTPTPNCW
ncbi:ATP-binding cassette domain-containing protein [Streptomyces sp. NPDC057543]|uniref:ATP-binding cassette domain-containing protein n=1 Tax=Streptomyces sp. NPDC057543 TaxID=3346163 RepID=UPI0036BFCD70